MPTPAIMNAHVAGSATAALASDTFSSVGPKLPATVFSVELHSGA